MVAASVLVDVDAAVRTLARNPRDYCDRCVLFFCAAFGRDVLLACLPFVEGNVAGHAVAGVAFLADEHIAVVLCEESS